MSRIKKGDRVLYASSHDPTVIYTVETVDKKCKTCHIRSSPDSPGSWPGAPQIDLVLVTPELEIFMKFLNTQLSECTQDKRIQILKGIFNSLSIF